MTNPGTDVYWRQFADFPLEDDELWPAQPYCLPLPNKALREASSVAPVDAFLVIGEAWAHMISHFLPPSPKVLDIGCGCGKLARFLSIHPGLQYLGVDLFLPAITWCHKAFTPLLGDRFRFEHFDGYSSLYNPQGSVEPIEYRLPAASGTLDTVVCASLFTHLLEADAIHYLNEIHRVLRVGGRAIISIHIEPATGKRFSGDESRIDIERQYFVELANAAGLSLFREIGLVYGQYVVILERCEPTAA
jgi:SAM-dependent methyltransferase